MLRARALELRRDVAGARRAYGDFLKNEAAERARKRPEYDDHAEKLDAFHGQATTASDGPEPGGWATAHHPPGAQSRRGRRLHVLGPGRGPHQYGRPAVRARARGHRVPDPARAGRRAP